MYKTLRDPALASGPETEREGEVLVHPELRQT